MPTHIPQPLLDLKAKLQTIPDPRTGRATRHEWRAILRRSLGAALGGAPTFPDLAWFGRCQHAWFKTWLNRPHGSPAHDPFTRVTAALDWRADKPQGRTCTVARWSKSRAKSAAG